MKELDDLIDKAVLLDKKSVGELISIFEDSRGGIAEKRKYIIQALQNKSKINSVFIGITGAPGSGKSSLIGRIAPLLINAKPGISAAVLAVDPSSKISGGSILGDRIRARFPPHEIRLFFRSQASENESGGTGRSTFQVSRVLRYLFDIVIIETVGTGQEDTDITQLSDKVFLVLQPNSGDRIQFIKAGIMEIPDFIILNKCDEDNADESFNEISNSVQFSGKNNSHLLKASAVTGEGLDEISEIMLNIKKEKNQFEIDLFYFNKWIQSEYGNMGMAVMEKHSGTESILSEENYFEDAVLRAEGIIKKALESNK